MADTDLDGVRRDVAELRRLVARLPDVEPWPATVDRPSHHVDRLRVITALLSTLDTYLRARGAPAVADGQPPAHAAPESVPDAALAAAAARYIASDLAARQLTEFTSAEGYRLARRLAQIGGVDAEVERLLAEAGTIRLHPAPLKDAFSHSAG